MTDDTHLEIDDDFPQTIIRDGPLLITDLPADSREGVVWVGTYDADDGPLSRVATTAQCAARHAVALARTDPAPEETVWIRCADREYLLANRNALGLEPYQASIHVQQHDLHTPADTPDS